MADLTTTFRQLLEGDGTLSTLLTGGVWDSEELPRERITAKNRPEIYESDGVTIKPFAAITWLGESPADLVAPVEERICDVFVYQHRRYDTIKAVSNRLKAMFQAPADRQVLADDATAFFIWSGNLGQMTAEELLRASMDRVRFTVHVYRS